jgi:RecB family exonuclease
MARYRERRRPEGFAGEMSLGIEEIIFPALADRSVRFVFPSEICAEAWLVRSLRAGGRSALESGRFLGWDSLKEEAARIEGRTPVGDPIRRIFAARVLRENAQRPFFTTIIPREYASEWAPFAGYIASKLPALGRLPAALRAAGAEGDPKAGDWLALRERYGAFLDEIGRFEPSYEPRILRSMPGSTMIFFPELIEDFAEYEAALAACPSVRLVRLPADPPRVRLRRPETALGELRDTLSEIGSLLDGGTAAADLAITIAGLSRYLPYLEREAALLSVPIAPRSGTSLAATTGGRLFAALREANASDFSYEALRDLLLSPAWPWKDREAGRALVSEGRALHVVAPWTEGGRKVDAWERSLSGRLSSWYRGLRRGIRDIAQAESFASLLKSYNVFKSEYLAGAGEGWDEGTNLSLARCVVELGALVDAEAVTGIRAGDASFGIFMRALEDKPYVRAGGESGVSVCDWRVSAGIYPERHFILGASQDALSVPRRGFEFLGEGLRKRLGPILYADPSEADRDSGPDFIRAYARSGASVSFSCPEVGWDGETAVHGFLLSLPAEEAADGGKAQLDSSYRDEAAWLSGRGQAPARLHRLQAAGIAASVEAGSVASGEGLRLEPETAARAAGLLKRRRQDGSTEELRSLDATAIDYYLACPFKYLYLRLLGAESESSGIDFVDAFFLGDVYHEALARLFERIREEDGRFRPERREAYRGFIEDCLEKAFGRLARKRGPFVAVILEAYRGRLEGYLEKMLETEAERFPNLEVGPIEEELEIPYPELAGGVVLRGRIDRISRSDKGAVIVDYKKGKVPDRARVAPDASGAIAEAQMPCYLRLVTAPGMAVDSAWYVSIEGNDKTPPAHPVCALGEVDGNGRGAYVPREGLEAFLAAFDAALHDTALGIERGDYPLAPKETQKEVCRDCGARGICRERYALRFSSSGAGARDDSGGGRP